ncbi:MAG TPA: MFS transporter [Mycobacteriales bacterium]|nr:MFS transporter [Mycobacteriales bacterium]
MHQRERLTLTALVLVITVVAVEAISVATTMPTVAKSLHGLNLFGWSFTAYLLADIVGMIDAGARADRQGPRVPLIGGLILFASGLLVDGLAPSMPVFMLGRSLQGLGGGSMIVSVYVVVARAFPEHRRPRVFAAISGAWVVPSMIGPALAGVVTDTLGWRWVFLGIAPLAVLGASLLLPMLRDVGGGSVESARRVGTLGSIALAGGLALVQVAGERLDLLAVPLGAVGVAVLARPLRRALPDGALRLAPGLPTVVLLRGVFSVAFFGAEAYLPLTLTRIHHGSPSVVGIPLTFAALGWAAGSWWQGRGGQADHPLALMRTGFAVVSVAVAALVVLTSTEVSLWFAVPLWAISGAGMGLGYPTISVLLLRLSPPAEHGANSAALQICDVIGGIVGVAAAATLVAAAGPAHLAHAMRIANPLLALIALLGVVLAKRAVPSSGSAADPDDAADAGRRDAGRRRALRRVGDLEGQQALRAVADRRRSTVAREGIRRWRRRTGHALASGHQGELDARHHRAGQRDAGGDGLGRVTDDGGRLVAPLSDGDALGGTGGA